jgi:hypothetical protein
MDERTGGKHRTTADGKAVAVACQAFLRFKVEALFYKRAGFRVMISLPDC